MAALISASPVPEDPSLVDAVEKNGHTSIVCVSLSLAGHGLDPRNRDSEWEDERLQKSFWVP